MGGDTGVLKSFSVVSTKECKEELAVLCFSIRRLYELPIFVLCDSETKEYIEGFSFGDINYNLSADPEGLAIAVEKVKGVNINNNFHSAAKIYLKMDCLDEAVLETGNTLFLDADIIIADKVHGDLSNQFDLMLSPHYHPTNVAEQNKKYGIFNAGYVWANSPMVAPAWRDIYLTRSNFYEQQGMVWLLELMDVGVFDKTHNFGFCRFSKEWADGSVRIKPYGDMESLKSFHMHTIEKTYKKADKGLKRGYEALYKILFPRLPRKVQLFIKELRSKT